MICDILAAFVLLLLLLLTWRAFCLGMGVRRMHHILVKRKLRTATRQSLAPPLSRGPLHSRPPHYA